MLTKLIACGADLNARKDDGITPLLVAVYNGDFEAVKALVAAGADVSLPLSTDPAQPRLDPATLADAMGHKQVAQFLKHHSS